MEGRKLEIERVAIHIRVRYIYGYHIIYLIMPKTFFAWVKEGFAIVLFFGLMHTTRHQNCMAR